LTVWVLFLSLALAACGGGGGAGGSGGGDGSGGDGSGGGGSDNPGDDHSAEEAAALVTAGKSGLEDLLSTPQTMIPFNGLADIADEFVQAAELDPSNPDAAFFGAVFKTVQFLGGDDTTNLLAKLGWRQLREECASEELIGGALGFGGSATTPTTVTTPCDNVGFQLRFGDFGVPIGPGEGGGSIGGAGSDLQISDILGFMTGSAPDALGQAVEWLDGLPEDFQTTLTFDISWLGSSGKSDIPRGLSSENATTFEIDYSDAKLIQAVLSSVRAVLVATTIWNYPGVDQFLADHRDGEGALGEILDADLVEYFQSGWDDSALPLTENSTGKANLKTSISLALKAVDQGLGSFTQETDDQSDDLLPQDFIFDLLTTNPQSYDDKAAVVAYFLEPTLQTARDLRNSVDDGSSQIEIYQAIAQIQDFETCEATLGEESPDTSPNNDSETNPLPDPIPDVTVVGVIPDGTPADPDSSSATTNYFTFTLSAPANISIYTSGSGDTTGTIGYDAGQAIQTWDTDAGSAEGGNFGLSIASTYFDGSHLPAAIDWPRAGLTFYVEVTSDGTTPYQLVVITDPGQGKIFLKGGGGRNYIASVYRHAHVNASLGGLIDVLAYFFDKSDRGLFSITGDSLLPHLFFDNGVLRAAFKRVFPALSGADINTSNFAGSGNHELLEVQPPTLTILGLDDPELPENDVSPLFGGPLAFCAPPKALSPAMGALGGYSPVNVSFSLGGTTAAAP
jgi:hypothetical protein